MDIDKLFKYHPPSPEQGIKYAIIRSSADRAAKMIEKLTDRTLALSEYYSEHDMVNAATKALAEDIIRSCPGSADTTAAIRCVRLVRNACNEYIVTRASGNADEDLLRIARDELIKARWQACSAIALN